MTFVFGLVAVARDDPWYVTLVFPAGGALWVRSMASDFADRAKGASDLQEEADQKQAFSRSSSTEPLPMSKAEMRAATPSDAARIAFAVRSGD
jgi:hypothetical protein